MQKETLNEIKLNSTVIIIVLAVTLILNKTKKEIDSYGL